MSKRRKIISSMFSSISLCSAISFSTLLLLSKLLILSLNDPRINCLFSNVLLIGSNCSYISLSTAVCSGIESSFLAFLIAFLITM